MDYAQMGFDAMAKAFSKAVPGRPYVGFTAPSATYDKMVQINAGALALDAQVKLNVKRDAFLQSWAAWLAAWKTFFEKNQSEYKRLGNIFMSDELAAQTDAYGKQLEGWQAAYTLETKGTPFGPFVPPTPQPDDKKDGFSLPWWGYSLLTLGALGLGYAIYRGVKETQAKKKYLEEKVLPAVMTSTMGPMGGQLAGVATAHDPSQYVQLDPQRLPNVILLSR